MTAKTMCSGSASGWALPELVAPCPPGEGLPGERATVPAWATRAARHAVAKHAKEAGKEVAVVDAELEEGGVELVAKALLQTLRRFSARHEDWVDAEVWAALCAEVAGAGEEDDGTGATLFRPDAEAALLLRSLGDAGAALATRLEERALARALAFQKGGDEDVLLHLWKRLPDEDGGIRFARAVARALWADQVLERWERMRANPPALADGVLVAMEGAYFGPGRAVAPAPEGALAIVAGRPAQVEASLPVHLHAALPGALGKAGDRVLLDTASLTAQRLLRRLILQGHYQKVEGRPDPRVVSIEGGFSGLAEQLALGALGRAPSQLRRILTWFQHVQLNLPTGVVGGLLTWQERRGRRGRPAELSIVLGTPLLPGYVHDIEQARGGGQAARRSRRLVPVPAELPPLVGRRNDHGAQAVLQLLLLQAMRERAEELVEHGAVELSAGLWAELCRRADLPESLFDRVWARWTAAGERDRILERIGGRLVRLGPRYQVEQRFLEASGLGSLRGRRAGRRSVRKRQRTGRSRGGN